MVIKVFMLSLLAYSNSKSYRVFCENKAGGSDSFSLAANLNVDEETKTVSTEAIVTLQDRQVLNRSKEELPSENNVIVVASRGFYREVDSLGGYLHTILVPLADSNEVLSMDLKINIAKELQSTVQLEETKTYYSNCKTL